MKFDKNKILTVVTADQARIGQKGWFAVLPKYIQENMSGYEPSVLGNIDLDSPSPFTREGGYAWPLFYPVPEPSYRPFTDNELNDLVGNVVVQNHTGNAMLIIKVVDSETGKVVSLGGSQKRNAQQLLDGWTFKDGHPCGVKEEV